MKKTEEIIENLKTEIESGQYGASGERFLSVRDFSDQKKLSFVTSYRIFNELKEIGILTLLKNKWFISCGISKKNSPLETFAQKNLIGLHVKEINNPYISENIFHLQKICEKKNFRLIIRTSENDYNNEKDALRFFIEAGCSGVINFPCVNEELSDFYKYYPLPMVFFGRRVSKDLSCVITDNFGTGQHVAKFLSEHGYTKFMFVGLETLPDFSNERLQGFEAKLSELDADFSENDVYRLSSTSNTDLPFFLNRVKEELRQNKTVGIFCLNDLLAYKVLKGLVKIPVSVPEQVGVIGYDNLPISTISGINITTIAYNFKELSANAIDALCTVIRTRQHIPDPIIISNHMLVRQSTK